MQRREQLWITSKPHSVLDIRRWILCNEFTQPHIMQETCAKASPVPRPRHRYDGQPHEECLTGRPASLIRICVKDDVHIEIIAEVVLFPRTQYESI